MPATLDSKYLDIQTESTKPKTTLDMGMLQQQAPAQPSENHIEV